MIDGRYINSYVYSLDNRNDKNGGNMSNYPTERWRTTPSEEQGIDYCIIENLFKTIHEEFTHINSVLVIKNDCIVAEKYFNGYTKKSKQKVGCIFKSFISATIGIALQERLIDSVSVKLVDLFPAYKNRKKDIDFFHITLEHVLTKSTGLKWKEPEYYKKNSNLSDLERFYELEITNIPGEVFEYKPDPQIAVCAIEQITGENFKKYCDERLFKKLNITDYYWNTNMDDIENMEITVRDVAKLGYLFLKKGKWEDKQLFSEEYWKAATSEKIIAMTHENTEYGYLWWIQELAGYKTFFASGFGGQYLCVIPEQEMIMVITSQMDRPHIENKFLIRNLLLDINNLKGEKIMKSSKRDFNKIKFSSEEKKEYWKKLDFFF